MAAKFTSSDVYEYYLAGYRSEDLGEIKGYFEWQKIELSEDEFEEFIETLEEFEGDEIPEVVGIPHPWIVRDMPRGDNGDEYEHYFNFKEEAVEYAKHRVAHLLTKSERKERHVIVGEGCYLYGWADGKGGVYADLQTVVWDDDEQEQEE